MHLVVIFVIAIFSWAYPSRIFRSQVLSIRQRRDVSLEFFDLGFSVSGRVFCIGEAVPRGVEVGSQGRHRLGDAHRRALAA